MKIIENYYADLFLAVTATTTLLLPHASTRVFESIFTLPYDGVNMGTFYGPWAIQFFVPVLTNSLSPKNKIIIGGVTATLGCLTVIGSCLFRMTPPYLFYLI